ncbi:MULTISPECIES: hypothetical protein [Serratia]|uniref:hypothetical protein n=1 Tax=Serratia TaxID=613 RepID=UPI000CE295B3|nr:hypothetical protein [Serratia marcescens]AVD62415.1 hypothetical protein C4B62_04015 [Serratia marcescens]ELL0332381.1 hypothetical protein [Serratia marcescens]MBH2548938.1 hypothetical protein [Serratia marcescens]
MEFVKKLEFGNYTLKFGDAVLLDYIDEIVMPSFFEMNYIRSIENKSDYFFINTEMVVVDGDSTPPVLGVQGRIVKNTTLTRDQVFEGNRIIEDHEELETAPSSFFLLLLNNHRLIFCKEVSGAPTIENFKSTSQYCLTQRYKEYIDELHEESQERRKTDPDAPWITKKQLRLDIPSPKLRITTLTDQKSLEEYIDLFEKINVVSINMLPTNAEEIDNDDFWNAVDQRRNQLNSKQAAVRFSNTEDGLNSHEVLEQLSAATELANSKFKVHGLDDNGDIMRGSNDNFILTTEVADFPTDTNDATEEGYEKFSELVADGRITLPARTSARTNGIIARLFERF